MSRLLDQPDGGLTYQQAGVDIDAGDEFVSRIGAAVASTRRPEVLGGLGGFSGLFALDTARYQNPVLVASADGVGTKLEVARLANRYDTVGRDLVAMLVDDLACVGAEPLFLLDYLAVGSIQPERMADLVAGIAEGCRLAGCTLLGGETAEHGGVMKPDDLDVAGFAVGVVERGKELGSHLVREGDALVGFASPGLRSNGYTLARRVLLDGTVDIHGPAWPGANRSLADELLEPSVIYVGAVQAVRQSLGEDLHAAAHITGGGITGNVVRFLPNGLEARVDMESFETPEIFFEIQRRGSVNAAEMVRVFNCGLGMVLALSPARVEDAISAATVAGVTAMRVGDVVAGERRAVVR